MCGIAGCVGPAVAEPTGLAAADAAMRAMNARGPDGHGLEHGQSWLMAHTRLAVLDLTDRARQPIGDGRGGWLVYNGEVYNFREIRAELRAQGVQFRSTGDSEVVLHALRQWGIPALRRFRGMFALAWLDEQRRELLLARDRYGVKPLAYRVAPDSCVFASDLFGLRALDPALTDVDPEAAYLYMALGYVPAPWTILNGVSKVRPGHYVRVRWSGAGVRAEEHSYWSMAEIAPAEEGKAWSADGQQHYQDLLNEAVRYRLVSDVPVGLLLSGGVDSTLAALTCRGQSASTVPTFTMGFENPEADESRFARAVAERLGTVHTEFRASSSDVLQVWERVWDVYDEPFADSSALPMVALCRRVATHVKVALTGDGGDEVLCGYPWHRALDRASHFSAAPRQVRRGLARAAAMLVPARRYEAAVIGEFDRAGQWSVLRTGLTERSARLLPVSGASRRPAPREYFQQWAEPLEECTDPLDWACRMDLLTYLPDDLMVKSDRAGMHVGLELREPLLDHELTAWCLSRPVAERYDRGSRAAKLPARRILRQALPDSLVARPKRGFTPPLADWLAGPLRPTVQGALVRLTRGDLFPLELPARARTWDECVAALDDRHNQFLWRVVCFSGWLSRYQQGSAAA